MKLYNSILDKWNEFTNTDNVGRIFQIRVKRKALADLTEHPKLSHLLEVEKSKGLDAINGLSFFSIFSGLTLVVDKLGDDMNIAGDFVIEELEDEHIFCLSVLPIEDNKKELDALLSDLNAKSDPESQVTWLFSSDDSFKNLWSKVRIKLKHKYKYSLCQKRMNEMEDSLPKSFMWARSDDSFGRSLGTAFKAKVQIDSDLEKVQGNLERGLEIRIVR